MKRFGFILILLGLFLIFIGNVNTKANINPTVSTRTPICEPLPECKLTPTETNTETLTPSDTPTSTSDPTSTSTNVPTETLTSVPETPTPFIVISITPTRTLVVTLTPSVTIKVTPTPLISKTPVPSITSTQIQPPITNTPQETERIKRTVVPQLLPETGIDKTIPFNITISNIGLGFIGFGIIFIGLGLKRK